MRTLRLRFYSVMAFLVIVIPQLGYAAKVQCGLMPQLFALYLKHHYSYKALTDTLKQNTADQLIKTVDASKTLFLQSDVDKSRPILINVFEEVKKGNCTPLNEIYKIATERAKENEEFVKKYVGPNY